jgi:EAL domain-containing protein (putative c-di-GMP-specific phosphodiesterase class I)
MLNVARAATRDNRIVPFYQPKVELATGQVVGFEALLRWRHDSLGIQTPDTICAAFEDTNLAIALGDQMYQAVAHDLRRWLDMGLEPGRVAINLAPAEFRHGHLIGRALGPFEQAGVPLDRVEIEITETVLLGRDTDKVASILVAFRESGARIALDDFGTGYASLTHLKAFPVDVIKIDQSFVRNLCDGSDDAAIVDAMVSLAGRLRIEVVAEGVQESEQAAYLQRRGCAFAQGHLFSPAVPAAQAEAFLGPGAAGLGRVITG